MNNILLGITGSVASSLAPKIVRELIAIEPAVTTVRVIMTNPSKVFIDKKSLYQAGAYKVYTDDDEWIWEKKWQSEHGELTAPSPIWEKNDPILHIEARKWATMLVIAPLSANTLGKMANGLCDNLLTSVVRAWDYEKPIVLAPAMNTYMYKNPITNRQIDVIRAMANKISVIAPQTKMLACGDIGPGALADLSDIISHVRYWTSNPDRSL